MNDEASLYSSSFEEDGSISLNHEHFPEPDISSVKKFNILSASETPRRIQKSNAFDMKLLNEAVRELQQLNHQRLASCIPTKRNVRTSRSRTFTEEQIQRIDQENGALVRRILEQQFRPINLPPRMPQTTAPFPSSSAINRKKKQQQIDRDNLVNT